MFEYEDVKIFWTGHDGFRLEHKDLKIHLDPFKLNKPQPVEIVITTHHHFDHCNPDDISKIANTGTILVGSTQCKDTFNKIKAKEKLYLKPGEKKEIRNIIVEAVPAYNINKYRDPKKGIHFHPKSENHIGIILNISGIRFYHAGDTDVIPEMKNIDVDVAFIPVSGTYVMTHEEALEAIKMIKAKLFIPMHYGNIVGSEDMAKKFKESAEKRVELLKIEK